MILRDLSLRHKVPLYIGALVLVVITAWTWLSYRNVRHAALLLGEQRLDGVITVFAKMYDSSARNTVRTIRIMAANAAVVDFVRSGGKTVSDTMRLIVRRSGARPNHRVGFFALDGTPIASFRDSLPSRENERHEELADEFLHALHGPDFAAVAPLRMMDDSVVVPVVAAVLKDSQPIGFLVLWRNVNASAQAREQASKLIGANARLYLGNVRGDLWADLGGAVQKFPRPVPLDGPAVRYTRADNTPVMAAARSVTRTPWAVAIEFADNAVMAPADQFLQRSVTVGLFVLLVATFAAWRLSRRLTHPLSELTEAASAVAAGDFSRAVTISRRDELGRLSEAFNTMAARVGESQHKLEQKVRDRTHEIQERNAELEAFAHSISHDLRAPLRAMHGFSQALLEDYSSNLDATGQDFARRISVAALRMDALTQDLLQYSRVGRGDISLESLDLGTVARDAIALVDAEISARHGSVVVHEPLPHAFGHRPLVEQAVANLVTNGVKFVADGVTPTVHIRGERHNGWVRLWVEDNGIGIDPAHHQRIFSVFERLHQSEEYSGTGIGLAIVRKAAERMGGRAGVDSTVGAGSRFWIELQSTEAST